MSPVSLHSFYSLIFRLCVRIMLYITTVRKKWTCSNFPIRIHRLPLDWKWKKRILIEEEKNETEFHVSHWNIWHHMICKKQFIVCGGPFDVTQILQNHGLFNEIYFHISSLIDYLITWSVKSNLYFVIFYRCYANFAKLWVP